MTSRKLRNHLLPLALPVSWTLASPLHAATITSVATGEWDVAATWSNTAAAPVTGTQGTGNDYVVASTFTVTSNDTANNTQAIIGQSLTVQGGGVLDLARLHNSTAQTVTLNLPPLTVQDGGELQFRSSSGTSNYNVAANINATGATTIDNTGGSYGQDINYSGTLSGSGTITYKTANSVNAVAVRTLAMKTATSPFTGDWFIQHGVTTGDDFGALRADAANALGTGKVTLDNRAQLINATTGGLNSLTGITLLKSTSSVNLGSGWTNPAGVLTATEGTVNMGSANSFATTSIATLNHGFGFLQFDLGSSPASADKLILSGDYTSEEGSPIDVRLLANPGSQTYELISYGGTLTGTPGPMVISPTRLTPTFSTGDGSNDKITVSFTGTTASLVWKGDDAVSPNAWDTDITPNFDNAGGPDRFLGIDNVVFNETATSFTPAVTGTVIPGSVTFNNPTTAYSIGGTGSIAGAGVLTKNGAADLTITSSNSFFGGTVLNAGRLRLGNNNALGTGKLTISGGSVSSNGTAAFTLPVALVINTPTLMLGDTTDTGALTFTGSGGTLGSNTVINTPNTASSSHAINGSLSDESNSFSITKDGAAFSLTLGGANSYDGGTTITAGRLGATNAGAYGSGAVSVADAAQAYISASGTTPNAFTIAGLGWAEGVGSLGAIRLGGGNTISGPVTLAADSRITAYNSTGTISGAIGETGGARKLEIGGAGLGATGGNLSLSGPNTYTGGTEVRGMIAVAKHNTAFGTGPVFIDEGAAVGHVTRVELQGVTVANDFTLDSTAQTGFLGPITASGGSVSTVSGKITITSGVGNGGHLASTGTGSVLRLTGELIVPGAVVPNVRAGTVEIGGGGTYPRLDQGEGTIRLIANNGVSPVAQLRLGVSNAGTFDLNGFNQTLSQINRATNPAATVTNSAATASVLTIDGTTDHAYNGTINNGTGGLSLVKNGSSVFTLGGASTYTGTTTVNAGTLKINAAHGVAAESPVLVSAGGTLGGTGPVNGEITVNGTVAPGNSAGMLLTNDTVTFAPGSRYAWEVADWTGTVAGTAWDIVDATELVFTATPANKLTIAISGDAANFTESAKTFEIARSVNAITGFNVAAIQIDDTAFIGNGTWTVQVSGNSINLVYGAGSGTPFSNWATANGIAGASGDIDSDGDGISNGIEFVIGGDPSAPGSDSNTLLPTVTTDATYINFTFRRTDESAGSDPFVQYTSALSGTWTEAQSGVDGVVVEETNNGFGTGIDRVTVKIPRTLASGAKLFARLRVSAE